MRLAPTAAAASFGSALAALAFAACSGGSAPPAASSGGGPGQSASPQGSGPAPSSSAVVPSGPYAACIAKPVDPGRQQICEGVVMTNGGAGDPDAGPSARGGSTCNTVASHRESFRCCFDMWSKDHPGKNVQAMVLFEVDREGKLMDVSLVKEKSTISDTGFEACVSAVAKSLEYPVQPGNAKPITKYRHPFDFKAK
jgi:hypothetical protein